MGRARDWSGNTGANREAVCEELERKARFPAFSDLWGLKTPEMRPKKEPATFHTPVSCILDSFL
jgi:hypothetical protein